MLPQPLPAFNRRFSRGNARILVGSFLISAKTRSAAGPLFFCDRQISLLRNVICGGKLITILIDDRMMRSESGVNADCSDFDLLPLIPLVANF